MGLDAFNINKPVRIESLIARHCLAPVTHILVKSVLKFLLAHVNGLLVLSNHADLSTGSHVRDAEVAFVKSLLDGAFDFAAKDVGA